jgi:hypothetical protein
MVSGGVRFILPNLLMMLADTEVQEKLGIRYDFTPALEHRRRNESSYLRFMGSRLRRWGDAPLTKEFVSNLNESIYPRSLEDMRARAVLGLRDASNRGSLPMITDRLPRGTPPFQCRACFRGWKNCMALHEHKRHCHVNREAYLEINALGLRLKGKCIISWFRPRSLLTILPDTAGQEKLGIRFDYVRNMRGFSESECTLGENMRSQLRAWGKAPLTEEFISNLGHSSNDEFLESREMERRRVLSANDPRDYSWNSSKKRWLLDPDAAISRKKSRRFRHSRAFLDRQRKALLGTGYPRILQVSAMQHHRIDTNRIPSIRELRMSRNHRQKPRSMRIAALLVSMQRLQRG